MGGRIFCHAGIGVDGLGVHTVCELEAQMIAGIGRCDMRIQYSDFGAVDDGYNKI